MKKFISAILCALLFVGFVLPVTAQGIVRVNPDVLTMEHFRYRQADLLVDEGKYAEAAIAFGKLGDYSDDRQAALSCGRRCPTAGRFPLIPLPRTTDICSVPFGRTEQLL